MTTTRTRKFPLFSSFRSTSLASVTALVLVAGGQSAFAGLPEVKALTQVLPAGVTLTTASSQELLTAFEAVIGQKKFSSPKEIGVVGGEALKAAGANATDAGTVFGQAILADAAPLPAGLDKDNFAAVAAKTAASGKGLNVLQIPDLTAALFAGQPDATFITVAQESKSKIGAGAIIGGRAILIANDPGAAAEAVTLGNTAIGSKGLSASAQSIAQFISAEVADSTAFAVHLADAGADSGSKPAFKYATAIAIGAAAGDPTNAGNIAHALFGEQVLDSTGTLVNPAGLPASAGLIAKADKSAAALAKGLAAVADIEEIQKIGNAIGEQIAKGTVKLATVNAITKTLATAVMHKPETATGENRDGNKRDEIAEVAAYIVAGLAGSPELDKLTGSKAKTAATKLLGIITSAAKVNPTKKAGVVGGPTNDTFAADVAGSVALTVLSAPTGTGLGEIPADIKAAFQTLMQASTTAKKINAKTVGLIQGTLTEIYTNSDPADIAARFENGFSLTGALSDPETDSHPFSTASL